MNLRCHFKDITKGYTKHYYAGSERVASKLGGGGIANITTPIVNTDYKRNAWQTPYANLWNGSLNLAPPCSTFFYSLLNAQTVQNSEPERYFYHPDHLGSASWITDSSGKAIQHLQYLPFGETRVDQRETSWSTRYSFSAKEKDEESGYGYFGARYYDSDLSIWLSVDPMADKYPSLNAYNYCANNPMILVDPNGEEIWIKADENTSYRYENGKLFNKDGSEYTGERTGFLGKTTAALDKLNGTKMGSKLIGELQNNKDYKLDITSAISSNYATIGTEYMTGNATNGLLNWNADKGEAVPVEGNQYGCSNAIVTLGHELSHAHDAMNNLTDVMDSYDNLIKGEWRAVYRENMIRSELKIPLRTHYYKGEDPIYGKIIGVSPATLDRNHKPFIPF
jgi:RHS repeat-associated protein